MSFQSLYRRYRPGRFSEIVGQEHVVAAVQNAVREDRVGHAYLFSGPRGTGKTSTARIMAKALNCLDPGDDGEPCDTCDSCVAFAAGTSYDIHELDAASNNGVDAIRDLIAKVALGSPGRTKVYVLDEVHMLTSGAENDLLKTLEEPPEHVKFMLCTTEPHKVVSTIRSRTQHLQFELLPADAMTSHVRWVAADAGLEIDDATVDHVVRAGGGSVRDTLSALDQVVAAGGIHDRADVAEQLVAGLAVRDVGQVVAALDHAAREGRDPRLVGEAVLSRFREAFLSAMGADLGQLSESDRQRAKDTAAEMAPAALTRGIELLGKALVDMRQAPDPRIDLELALVRLARPQLDTDLAAVVERLDRLEQGQPASSSPSVPAPTSPPASEPGESGPAAEARAQLASSDNAAAATTEPAPVLTPEPTVATATEAPSTSKSLGARRRAKQAEADPPADSSASPAPIEAVAEPETTSAGGAGAAPSHDELTLVWADQILNALPNRARARFSAGRFLESTPTAAVFALPNEIHRERCGEVRAEVEAALAAQFGRPVAIELVVDDGRAATPPPTPTVADDHELIEIDQLADAPIGEQSGVEKITDAFPGAELVEEPETT